MKYRSSLLVVCLLVLLSGCSGSLSAGGVGSPAADDVSGSLPPGVNETTAEPQELANAHGSTLSATTYETNHTTQVTFANGTVYAEVTHAGTVTDSDHYVVAVEQRGAWTPVGAGSRVVHYADDETAQRLTVSWSGDRSVSPMREEPSSVVNRLGLADDDTVYQLLTSAETVQVSVSDSDSVLTEIKATGAQPIAPSYVSDPGPANATLQVTSEGVVTKLVVRYDATVDGERVQVRTTVSYDAVGEATVDHPDWVDDEA